MSSLYCRISQKLLGSLPGGSVINSALFFRSSLFIFSANRRAFDFNVFFAFLPFLEAKILYLTNLSLSEVTLLTNDCKTL